MTTEEPKKKLRGFAAMDPAKQLELARKGGAAVPAEKRTFSTRPELAKEAGRVGGKNVPPTLRSFYTDRALARKAGFAGGISDKKGQKKYLTKPSR
jgi:general stress protein YciG